MKLRHYLLSGSILALPLWASAVQAAAPQSAGQEESIGEIVVTAQRREENIQRVPISIQALTSESMQEKQVVSFADYAKLLPSVSFRTLGPGRSDIFFRGITTGNSGFPTSGMYLDEIPVQSTARTLDVHLYDIARVEALSGPQGTLFGASSLAGTVRVITNKPDPARFLAGVDVQANKYGAGDAGGMFEGFANIPVADNAAVRLVGFYEKLGGYIDNKPSSVTYQFGDNDPSNDLTVNNNAMVEDNFNPVETFGGRVSALVNLNDNWTFTPQVMYQAQDSRGSFLFLPRAGDLAVHDYGPTRNRDQWSQMSATIEGRIGLLDVIYSTGFLARQVSTDNDYTYYSVAYDAYPGYTDFPDGMGGFINPTQRFNGGNHSRKQTHELRVSTPQDNTWRLTTGLFYQRQDNHTWGHYYVPGVSRSQGAYTRSFGPVFEDDLYLYDDYNRILDYAVFAEGSYEITPSLTLTAGIRGFGHKNDQRGFEGVTWNARAMGCPVPLPHQRACHLDLDNYKETGETHKANLQWQIDSDKMVYFTYSTGFRPGGFNQVPGVKPYSADTLDNFEIGYKVTLNNVLRLNGAFYFERWNGLQYRIVVPNNNGQVGTYNAGQAEVKGLEFDAAWLASDRLTITANGAYNNAALSKDLCNLDTTLNQLSTCTPGPTTAATKGARLPFQPKIKLSASARYEMPIGTWTGYGQAIVSSQTSTTQDIRVFQNGLFGNNAGFTTFDFTVGGKHDDTTVEFFIQNAFDKRGILSKATFCTIEICQDSARSFPVKPRFFGVKVSQRFF